MIQEGMLPASKQRLLVLIGPTAVGKTAMSITLAKRYHAEIISGDSMQVYRGMNIGTAKITAAEMQGIPHHLVNIHQPDHLFSVSEFQERAKTCISEIAERGKLPFLVGGTGLYVESICYEFAFSEAASDEWFRLSMQTYADERGNAALHAKLMEIDPTMAYRLHPNDVRRIIRSLEIFHVTGKKHSELLAAQTKESPYQLCIIGLTMERALLYKRIEERIDTMLRLGLEDEVRALLAEGYDEQLPAMQAIGYKELIPWIQGKQSRDACVELLKKNTRHFAKRQLSWFRHMKHIHWVDVSDDQAGAYHLAQIQAHIETKL